MGAVGIILGGVRSGSEHLLHRLYFHCCSATTFMRLFHYWVRSFAGTFEIYLLTTAHISVESFTDFSITFPFGSQKHALSWKHTKHQAI